MLAPHRITATRSPSGSGARGGRRGRWRRPPRPRSGAPPRVPGGRRWPRRGRAPSPRRPAVPRQGVGGDPGGTERVGRDGIHRDVHGSPRLQGGVQGPAVLGFGRHDPDAVLARGGGHTGEQPAAAHRDDHRVQAGKSRPDLVEQGAGARRDQRVVVRVAAQGAALVRELPAGGQCFGVPVADEPHVGPVPAQPLDLHPGRVHGQEHGGGHPLGAGRPGAGEARVAPGGYGHPGRGEGARLAVRDEEVPGPARLEGAGVLEVFQGVPDAPVGGHDGDGTDHVGHPAGGGAHGRVVELLLHERSPRGAVADSGGDASSR